VGGIYVINSLLDDSAFQVLRSFRPYLGNRGNDFLATLESIQELVTSEPAQKTAECLRSFGFGDNFSSQEVQSETEPNPYNLFLILSLLFVADIPKGGGPLKGVGVQKPAQELLPVQITPIQTKRGEV
jgi:hypothetical protein